MSSQELDTTAVSAQMTGTCFRKSDRRRMWIPTWTRPSSVGRPSPSPVAGPAPPRDGSAMDPPSLSSSTGAPTLPAAGVHPASQARQDRKGRYPRPSGRRPQGCRRRPHPLASADRGSAARAGPEAFEPRCGQRSHNRVAACGSRQWRPAYRPVGQPAGLPSPPHGRRRCRPVRWGTARPGTAIGRDWHRRTPQGGPAISPTTPDARHT